MQSTRALENRLRGTQLIWQCRKSVRRDLRTIRSKRRASARAQRIDGCLAADAATGCQVKVPRGGFGEIDAGSKLDGNGAFAVFFHPRNLSAVVDHALGEEETGSKRKIVTRRAHGDREILAVEADLQGLFDGNEVLEVSFGRGAGRSVSTGFKGDLAVRSFAANRHSRHFALHALSRPLARRCKTTASTGFEPYGFFSSLKKYSTHFCGGKMKTVMRAITNKKTTTKKARATLSPTLQSVYRIFPDIEPFFLGTGTGCDPFLNCASNCVDSIGTKTWQ